jgi:hypothetical protein
MVVLAAVAVTVGELGSVLFAVVVIEALLGELVGGSLIDFRRVAGVEFGELRSGVAEFAGSVLVNIEFAGRADAAAAALGSRAGMVVVTRGRF